MAFLIQVQFDDVEVSKERQQAIADHCHQLVEGYICNASAEHRNSQPFNYEVDLVTEDD